MTKENYIEELIDQSIIFKDDDFCELKTKVGTRFLFFYGKNLDSAKSHAYTVLEEYPQVNTMYSKLSAKENYLKSLNIVTTYMSVYEIESLHQILKERI
jgi:hypothetical protein